MITKYATIARRSGSTAKPCGMPLNVEEGTFPKVKEFLGGPFGSKNKQILFHPFCGTRKGGFKTFPLENLATSQKVCPILVFFNSMETSTLKPGYYQLKVVL